jgi:hypothetical protein
MDIPMNFEFRINRLSALAYELLVDIKREFLSLEIRRDFIDIDLLYSLHPKDQVADALQELSFAEIIYVEEIPGYIWYTKDFEDFITSDRPDYDEMNIHYDLHEEYI